MKTLFTNKPLEIRGYTVPVMSPVEWNEKNKTYYINPSCFMPNTLERHDATYYGFPVNIEDVYGLEKAVLL